MEQKGAAFAFLTVACFFAHMRTVSSGLRTFKHHLIFICAFDKTKYEYLMIIYIVGILVLPSTFDGEASSAFADLFEERAPPLLKHLVRDSHAVIHYVIVHDARTTGSKER